MFNQIISHLAPFILWLAQAFYTSRSIYQIRFEELSESVRNVFWLQNQTIYDGISSNVGWYGTLMVFYNLFGFNLFAAKIFRLLLHALSLICLNKLLKKHLGLRKSLIPLLVISLSPTLLFFNSLQTSFGIDLQYLPICLYLISSLNFKKPKTNWTKQLLLGLVSMIATMSYPSFIPYLPFLAFFYFKKVKAKKIKNSLIPLLASIFLFILSLLYLKQPSLLIYDSHNQSGIFRGGSGGKMNFNPLALWQNISQGSKLILNDLFLESKSYYFELSKVEFSGAFTGLAAIIIFIFPFFIFLKNKREKETALLAYLLVTATLILTNLTGWFAGLRRSTPVLVGFYTLFTLVWSHSLKNYSEKKFLSLIGIFSCLTIIGHHLVAYRPNLHQLTFPSQHKENACFNVFTNNPVQSLNFFINQVKNTGKLQTFNPKGEIIDCRLHEIYPAVAGSCQWNKLDCPEKILFYDEKSKQYIPLTIKLWEDYYFPH